MVIGEESDNQVCDYLQVLKKNGTPVNTAIAIACADRIVRNKDKMVGLLPYPRIEVSIYIKTYGMGKDMCKLQG